MLRSILKTAISSSKSTLTKSQTNLQIPTSHFSSKTKTKSKSKSSGAASKNKDKQKVKPAKPSTSQLDDVSTFDDSKDVDLSLDEESRIRHLAEEANDKSLDVGPNGRPLFTKTTSVSNLTRKDAGFYMDFSLEELNEALPEGLPDGMTKEFDEAKRNGILVRESFLDLRDNYRRIVDPSLQSSGGKGPKVRKQIVLDGPVACGKSIALAMLVKWAREEGWLVFYVPKGKDWTHGGFFYQNPQTNLWDTPAHSAKSLQDFLKYNEARLQQLPCQIFEPIPLGEGAGVGKMRGVDSMAMPEGSKLYDLIQTGITHSQAAVGVLVRLRNELSLVKDTPVLIAIDQYNSWFTFSEYGEPITVRSTRPIHAKELATVREFRPMMHDDMMVGAFSHSTAVGKLRQDLPDVPFDARLNFPRYNLDEAGAVCHYYARQRLIRREAFSEEKWKKIYYLANGNGAEIRWLAPFVR